MEFFMVRILGESQVSVWGLSDVVASDYSEGDSVMLTVIRCGPFVKEVTFEVDIKTLEVGLTSGEDLILDTGFGVLRFTRSDILELLETNKENHPEYN